ncbi:MAG: rhomboid family intramembrane serine protease, partial [Planctomycetes bacterium]|nr:rhomboid family intramembrane serine protease [Planctomycetota bacterium]
RHLFWNMLALFFFAGDVERELGTKRFLRLYFACGVSGALLSCLARPEDSLVGASAGVLGVLVAFAILYPHAIVYLIVLPIRARYLAIGIAILSVLWAMEQDPGSRVSHWGHLGGMAYAFVTLWVLPRMGWRLGLPSWLSVSRWRDRRREDQRLRQARRQAEVQEELDRILAKVHQQGLSNLTESERRFLKRVSKRYRDG